MTAQEEIKNAINKINIKLTNEQCEQFYLYFKILIEWNQVMNLTAITNFQEVIVKHFEDSLILSKYVALNEVTSIIDIGTGAGLPGIPLKIVFPNITLVLVDSLKKRVKFLNEVITKLELNNIKAIHGRAEELGHQEVYRENFDICVSRAVANLSTLTEYCLPFVRLGGNFISYKAGNIEEELELSHNAVSVLGGEVRNTYEYVLPGTDIERSLVRVQKVKLTNIKYPRSSGKPSKKPL